MTVYVYNESTGINSFSTEDYGLISAATTVSVDNGLITEPNPTYTPAPSPEDDWYLISVGETLYPYGSLFTLSSGRESITYATYVASGNISFIAKTATEKVTFTWVGNGTLFEIGSGLERTLRPYVSSGTLRLGENNSAESSLTVQTADTTNTQLFSISGFAVEKDVDVYNGTGLLSIDGSSIITQTGSIFGSGSLILSDSANTSRLTPYVGFGTLNLSSNVIESETETYIGFGTLPSLYNSDTVHPFVDYTPHYGIDQNIGVGTFGIRFVPGAGFTPDGDGNPRDAKTYSNRYGNVNGDTNSGSGIGTFRFDQVRNLAVYSPLTPYFGVGLFVINGSVSESFTKSTYFGLGQIGISSGATGFGKFGTYTYAGLGTVVYDQENAEERISNSYVGEGLVVIDAFASDIKKTKSYVGIGVLGYFSGASESSTISQVGDSVLFNISGTSVQSLTINPTEDTILHQISGESNASRTYVYEGDGNLSIAGYSDISITRNDGSTVLFHFETHISDSEYDTCDSTEVTCDYQDAALVSFVSNPPENTVLFNVSGLADTREIDLFVYSGIGSVQFVGGFTDLKLTNSYSGIGTLSISSNLIEKESEIYIGIGTILKLSGGSESRVTNVPQNTILFEITGSAQTRIELEYSNVGVGNITISGDASTRQTDLFEKSGTGLVTIYGDTSYRFVPSPEGSGIVSIGGFADNSLSKTYNAVGSLFAVSSGRESYIRSTYTGLGTIYILQNVGITTINPFQIPRTYVCII